MSRNKVGPVFSLNYLGSAILANGKTGLGCLQQPLRELYSLYRQYGLRLVQDRRLIVTDEGITMLYNESGVEKYSHHELTSVYDAQLLKYFCKRENKKYSSAFLPIGQEFNPKYVNLYFPLEKQYSDVFESLNPAIVTLLLRRSTGIQALECHVFITRSINEGKSIVNRIHEVCDFYKSNLSQQANLFQYKPYPPLNNERVIRVNDNTKLVSSVRSSQQKEPPLEIDKHKRSKSVTSMNPRPSVFSKIKANFKENKFIKKKTSNDTSYDRNKFDRNINRSSIKSAPDHKNYQNEPFQSELSLMVKKQPISIKNKNDLLTKSSSSIKSESYLKKEKKISFPKRFLISARESIKSSRSPVASQSSLNKTSAKYASTTSIADLDFRDPKSIFDRNLLIDGSYPSLPPSRSVSPTSMTHHHYKSDAKVRQSSTDQSNKNKLYRKNLKSPQLTLKDICNKQDTHSYVSTSSEKALQNQYSYDKYVSSKQIDNLSQIYKANSIVDSSDESENLKSPVKNPEILSNHLVWNPTKRAPECMDGMSIRTNSPPLMISSENRNMCEQLYTKIDPTIQNGRLKNIDQPQISNRNSNSPFFSTTPVSEILDTSLNKLKFKDSAYNTNSSNDDNENNCFDKKYVSAFSYVNKVENASPDLNQMHPSQKNHVNNYLYQNQNNSNLKSSLKQFPGGVKVFPPLPISNYNLGLKQVPKEYPITYNQEIHNKKSIVEYQKISNREEKMHQMNSILKNQNVNDIEIIDLTRINENKIDSQNMNKIPHKMQYSNLDVKMKRNLIQYAEDQNETQNSNYIYYFNNDNFGGY